MWATYTFELFPFSTNPEKPILPDMPALKVRGYRFQVFEFLTRIA